MAAKKDAQSEKNGAAVAAGNIAASAGRVVKSAAGKAAHGAAGVASKAATSAAAKVSGAVKGAGKTEVTNSASVKPEKALTKVNKAEAKALKLQKKAAKKAAAQAKAAAKAEKKAASKATKADKPAKAAKADKPVKKAAATDDAVEIMTARLFFTAAFPTIQVLLDDDPKLHAKFAKTNKTIQFGAKNGKDLLCCTMKIKNGTITSEEGPADKPDLTLTFPSVEKMNALLKGGLAVPTIKGDVKLLTDFLPLLLGLKVMAKPNKDLKDDAEKRLKVKMSLYMITRALSKYNKLGDPDMVEFCMRQPERIYQFAVDDGDKKDAIACYLRVSQGKTKSGHGIYERRSPFVLFHFFSIDGALKVLGSECEFVEGVENGYVETIGSPEYACYLNDYMAIIQGMMM